MNERAGAEKELSWRGVAGEGSSEHHFEGRYDLVKEDMKKMTGKEAGKARPVEHKQAGLPGRVGVRRERGMR